MSHGFRFLLIAALLCATLAAVCSALPLPRALHLARGPFSQQQQQPPERSELPPWLAPDTSSPIWSARRWLEWWRGGPEALERVVITPVHPNGTRASPAELFLPRSQLRAEGFALRPIKPGGNEPLDGKLRQGSAEWFDYNASAATPLVPTAFAWMADDFSMHGRADDGLLDIDVARGVSRLVAAAYCNISNLPTWNCTRCEPNFTPQRVVFDPLWDLLGFVGWSDELNGIVVAFRGTDSHSYYNWVENMRTWRTDLALALEGIPPHALVHGGFFYSYNSSFLAGNISAGVQEILEAREAHPKGSGGGGGGGPWLFPGKDRDGGGSRNWNVSSAPTVFVSGHSLGGALATLCALDLKVTLGLPDVRVVTFGSPRVGNYIFAKWFEEEIGPHWRFTHNRDIVPSVPPGYMGFYHVAQEVWVVDMLGRTLVGVCDGSGEDARCHNSMCHLGLCSSVADHLLYLSEMYSPHPEGC